MKRLAVISFLLLTNVSLFAQKYRGNVWCFGDSAGIDWTNPNNPLFFKSMMHSRSGTASISDSSGNLMLYAGYKREPANNRGWLLNKYHQLVQNGDTLFFEDWYHSVILIPSSNDSIVILMSISVTNTVPYGLYYSIINYKANNDSGIVTQKNIQLNNLPSFDGLAAVRHGNGRNWWLIFRDNDPTPPFTLSNKFYIYLVNESGPAFHHTQFIGTSFNDNGGQFIFNNECSKFYICTFAGVIEFFDFDRCTGFFSNPTVIEPTRTAQPYPYYNSLALSPDETKLYISAFSQLNTLGGTDSIYQFDLTVSNISASKIHLYGAPNTYIGLGGLRKAPDNKIYHAAAYENYYPYQDTSYNVYNTHLSVINQPDSLGLACDFQPFSFYLGGARTYYGLPNNPDYELGAWVGSPCDTLGTVGVEEVNTTQEVFFQAWYNHEWDMIHVNAAKLKGKKALLRLFDVQGRLVYERKMEVIPGGYVTGEIPMLTITNGVYVVSLVTELESISSKTVKF